MKEEEQIQRLEARVKALEQELQTVTQLVLMGMHSAIWQHSVVGHVITIRDIVDLIRHRLRGNDLLDSISKDLQFINDQVSSIFDTQTLPSLSLSSASSFSINDFLHERLDQLRLNAQCEDLQVKWELESSSQPYVRISPQWLRRCMDILIDNAIKAMQGSSEKTLTLGTKTVGDSVHIHITDTGVGIPPNILHKLFREPIIRDDRRGNLGVGLLLAKIIINAFEGDIQLTHSPQNGASFVITLPTAESLRN